MEFQGSDYMTKEGDKISLEEVRGKLEARTGDITGMKVVFNATKIEQIWLIKASGRSWLTWDHWNEGAPWLWKV